LSDARARPSSLAHASLFDQHRLPAASVTLSYHSSVVKVPVHRAGGIVPPVQWPVKAFERAKTDVFRRRSFYRPTSACQAWYSRPLTQSLKPERLSSVFSDLPNRARSL
jgi:hypothetical protein